MKNTLFAFGTSLLMLGVIGAPIVQNQSEQEKLVLYRCELIDGPTKALFNGEKPIGWKEPDFNDASWTDAVFPLAENVFCPQLQEYGAPGGPFPVGERIVTRNKFSLDRYPQEANIYVVADNLAKVFVNGHHVFTTPEQGGCEGVSTVHRIDLALDDTSPLRIGENVVAVNAQDFGGQSFLHVRMAITETVPCKEDHIVPPNELTYFECGVINGATKALVTGEKPLGWKERGFDDASWDNVRFPLAENVFCDQLKSYGPPGGPFPVNQRIVTRNTFFLHRFPLEADPEFFATIYLVADNFAKVFVNGVEVFETPEVGGCAGVSTRYEIKLAVDETTPLLHGENVVAVNAQDFGGQSFLQLEMQIGGGQPCELF